MIRHRRTAALLLAAVIPAAMVLSGCSVVDELVYHERTAEFETASDLTMEWPGMAAWVPDDASDIRIRESTEGDVASLLLTSDSSLDTVLCAEVDRLSAPALTVEGAPDPYTIADAFACGAWTVVAADDGWYGWTPNAPDEAAHSPS
jgi:hypothetical protein